MFVANSFMMVFDFNDRDKKTLNHGTELYPMLL